MIDSFQGQYRWLSNFWPAVISYEGLIYPTVEHAYQASKTLDKLERKEISLLDSPVRAKRAGRKVKMRSDWNIVKLDIMKELLTKKFSHPQLRKLLLDTGIEMLVEGNKWHDLYWGKCSCSRHSTKGENNLGKLLMEVRLELGKE